MTWLQKTSRAFDESVKLIYLRILFKDVRSSQELGYHALWMLNVLSRENFDWEFTDNILLETFTSMRIFHALIYDTVIIIKKIYSQVIITFMLQFCN